MEHPHHQRFVRAISERKKVKLRFWSKEDNSVLVRTCAPLDFAPSRRARDKTARYHFWDYDSDKGSHILSLLRDQIAEIEVLEEGFLPGDIVTWDLSEAPWGLPRDWGNWS